VTPYVTAQEARAVKALALALVRAFLVAGC
jgi:hypothetical protein